ncbi:MAG: TIGR04282 family arsenosugar biosynthesis glycosyltransferase [Burkholderiales bacterium]|nr:TIGR04282 family arsenosugar biosynthesis glycosyltransferase [Burkholderiales bacterium]
MIRCAESRLAILVFARAPEPGRAKTRLIPLIGAEAAARLQARMTASVLAAAQASGAGEVQLWCTPSREHEAFQCHRNDASLSLHSQRGDSLGERLRQAHDVAFRDHQRVVMIGTDCPALGGRELRAAGESLLHHDAHIVPAEDGGYVLLGLSRPCPALFEGIDWGTASVLAQTLERIRGLALSCRVSEPLWDVDRPEDYRRLTRLLPRLAEGLPAV